VKTKEAASDFSVFVAKRSPTTVYTATKSSIEKADTGVDKWP
jgi:hypothetical protein